MSGSEIWILFRMATDFPPPDEEYVSAGRRGTPPRFPLTTEDMQRRWNEGLSSYDTEAAAIEQVIASRGRYGRVVVRFDIPPGSGLWWEKTGRNPHHDTLYGDFGELRRYLVPGSAKRVDLD